METNEVLLLTTLTMVGILLLVFGIAYLFAPLSSNASSDFSVGKVVSISISSIILSMIFFGVAVSTQQKINKEDCIDSGGIWTKRESEPYYHAGLRTITVDRHYSCDDK